MEYLSSKRTKDAYTEENKHWYSNEQQFTSHNNKFQDLQKTVLIDWDKLGKNHHLYVVTAAIEVI